MNEVRDVYSAPQILIMQYIHGVDAITEVKPVRSDAINMREYKEQLKAMYDSALVKRDQSIDKIFGALGQLPVRLPDDLLEKFDIVDEDDVIAVAKSVTRSDKNAQLPHNSATQVEQDRLDKIVPPSEIDMSKLME